MNFTINRDLFMNNLNNANRALSTKTPMPILTGIKIEVLGDQIVITTSNSDISMKLHIKGEGLKIEETGSMVIPGRYLIDIVRKIDANEIQVYNHEDNVIKILAGKSDFTLSGMNLEDYPQISFLEEGNVIDIDVLAFKNIIKQTTFATSIMENRPILTGLNFETKENELKCVATDSYRLAQKVINLDDKYPDLNVIIPSKSLDDLTKILDDVKEKVTMVINDGKVLFKYKNILFQSRLLEGTYPKTTGLIPTEFSVQVKFDKQELITIIDRASLLISPTNGIVKLNIRPDKIINISSSGSEIGRVVEEISPIEDIVGPALKISFNAKYMLEALRSFDSNELTINFTGETRPFIITGNMDDQLIQLILPVRTE